MENAENSRRQMWDQQPNEPNEAYARFTTYLTLGPTRSLAAANAKHSEAAKGNKKQRLAKRPAGSWTSESVRWNWVERAHAWDAHRGRKAVEHSEHVVSQLYHDCVIKLLQLALKRSPKNYLEFLEGFKVMMTAYDPIIQSYLRSEAAAGELKTIPFSTHGSMASVASRPGRNAPAAPEAERPVVRVVGLAAGSVEKIHCPGEARLRPCDAARHSPIVRKPVRSARGRACPATAHAARGH